MPIGVDPGPALDRQGEVSPDDEVDIGFGSKPIDQSLLLVASSRQAAAGLGARSLQASNMKLANSSVERSASWA